LIRLEISLQLSFKEGESFDRTEKIVGIEVDPTSTGTGAAEAFSRKFCLGSVLIHNLSHLSFSPLVPTSLLSSCLSSLLTPFPRYDVVCPCTTAFALHKAFPSAAFHLVPDAGHSAKEPGIMNLLIQATDQYKSAT